MAADFDSATPRQRLWRLLWLVGLLLAAAIALGLAVGALRLISADTPAA